MIKEIKGWISLKKPKAEKIALNFGIIKGHKDYTKFIILGRSRTGSNFLRGLINNNSQVISVGEIFRNEDRIDWDSSTFETNSAVLALYQEDPARFLNKYLFRKFPFEIKAVGFKLFYYHAQNPPFLNIWRHLEDDKEIHILHIKRKNLLQTHISRIRASQNDSWVNTTGEKEQQTSVYVDPINCLKDFEQTRKWELDADYKFQQHPKLEIYYEDLSNDYESVLESVQSFLGLSPFPAQPRTFKQSDLPLAESISNYKDLKEYFKNSIYENFFVE